MRCHRRRTFTPGHLIALLLFVACIVGLYLAIVATASLFK